MHGITEKKSEQAIASFLRSHLRQNTQCVFIKPLFVNKKLYQFFMNFQPFWLSFAFSNAIFVRRPFCGSPASVMRLLPTLGANCPCYRFRNNDQVTPILMQSMKQAKPMFDNVIK